MLSDEQLETDSLRRRLEGEAGDLAAQIAELKKTLAFEQAARVTERDAARAEKEQLERELAALRQSMEEERAQYELRLQQLSVANEKLAREVENLTAERTAWQEERESIMKAHEVEAQQLKSVIHETQESHAITQNMLAALSAMV